MGLLAALWNAQVTGDAYASVNPHFERGLPGGTRPMTRALEM